MAWTLEQEQYLRDNYGRLPFGEVMNYLGKTRGAISGKADRFGLSTKGILGPRRRIQTIAVVPERKTRFWSPPVDVKPHEETMPQLTGDEKLHSRIFGDLEPGMCNWPLYVEQGVQMYCAAQTERLPGRYDAYCKCHRDMSQQPRAERQQRYKRRVWAR